jgi:hypothetical protein
MPLEVESVPVRSATVAEWNASSVILGLGELGVANDTGEIKDGDGVNTWANLGKNPRRGRVTLVAGTATVPMTTITATTIIQLTAQVLGTVTTPQALAVTNRTAGTNFVVTSASNTDTSQIGWVAYEA